MTLAPPINPPTEAETQPRPHLKMTRSMIASLMNAGLLSEGPFELIEGEIIYKMGKNEPHIFITSETTDWLREVFGTAYVRSQEPIALNETNEPEPDVAVLLHTRRHYLTAGTPPAADVRLVIEVAHTTLWYDRTVKARLYAEAGIPDYWVFDVNGRQVFVHREPQNGAYQLVTVHLETESIAPLAAPQSAVLISTLLP